MSVQRYDIFGVGEARPAIDGGEWMRYEAHAATVAALEERVKLLEGLLGRAHDWLGEGCNYNGSELDEAITVALAPTGKGGSDA